MTMHFRNLPERPQKRFQFAFPISALAVFLAAYSPILIAPSVQAEEAKDSETTKRDAEISVEGVNLDAMRSDIEFLADDSLRGRGTDDEYIDQAADYLAARMEEIGLRMDAVDGSPFQPLSIPLGARPGEIKNNQLIVATKTKDAPVAVAKLGDGMNPMTLGTPNATVNVPLSFAGYGITAADLNYDDYAKLDVSGHAVIILRKEPGMTDPNSIFDGTETTQHALFATKIRNAIDHGAAAVILVNDAASVESAVEGVKRGIESEKNQLKSLKEKLADLPESAAKVRKNFEDQIEVTEASIQNIDEDIASAKRGVLPIAAGGSLPAGLKKVPVISIGRDVVDSILAECPDDSFPNRKRTLAEIESRIDAETKPLSFNCEGLQANLSVEIQASERTSNNVIGVFDGAGDLANETLVVGAHYDHVGMGGYGSLTPGTIAVHNGADDNASGTVTMLGVADALKKRLSNATSRRRVVFIAFTGEERGLLGSKHYVRNPRFDIDQTVAMLNLDMVGRLRENTLTVYGTGSGDVMDEVLEAAHTPMKEKGKGFTFEKIKMGYGPSDHQSFYEVDVPVLFFFTGLHNDYHRPSDDFDKINYKGMKRIGDMVADIATDLATRAQRPKVIRMGRPGRGGRPNRGNRRDTPRVPRVLIGIQMQPVDGGIGIQSITEGGSAERAGLQAGDVITKLDDKAIRTVQDLIGFLATKAPNDEVKVMFERGGESKEATVKLDRR